MQYAIPLYHLKCKYPRDYKTNLQIALHKYLYTHTLRNKKFSTYTHTMQAW